MNLLSEYLTTHSIYYVTRDEERALGLPKKTEGYTSISNNAPFRNEGEEILGTRELMQATASHIPKGANVLVFKNTKAIERVAADHGWNILNPSADLANTIEEKISQYAWLGELASLLPPTHIATCKDLTWGGEIYVVQFNHAHSGEGTHVISNQQDVDDLKEKFPDRPVRVSQFVDGPMFTVNAIVHSSGVLVSSPSYQITGLSPFTDNAFTTIGNDWGAANAMLTDEQKKIIEDMALEIGEKMKEDAWKGLFGIDVIVEKSTGNVYLIEINARQPASVTYESTLQRSFAVDRQPLPNPPLTKGRELTLSTFEAHLGALLDLDLSEYTLTPVTSGAQIIQRITDDVSAIHEDAVMAIKKLGCTVRTYSNDKVGSELLRIQSDETFISEQGILSKLGISLVRHLE